MIKSDKKLSVRERKQKQEMRRWLMFGGGAFGLVAGAGVGVTFLDPSFPTLGGEGTLNERFEQAGIEAAVLRLTPDLPSADIFVVGSTDCSYCRSFVEDGLDDLIAFAEQNELGLAYTSVGGTAGSLTSAKMLNGFARFSDESPGDILKSIYAASEEISSGKNADLVAQQYGAKLGLSLREIGAAMNERSLNTARHIQATRAAFPIQGTPMFYVSNQELPERINMFSGWPGADGLRRQISSARSV